MDKCIKTVTEHGCIYHAAIWSALVYLKKKKKKKLQHYVIAALMVNECMRHAVHFRGIDVLKHATTLKGVDILNHSATLWVSACTKRTLQPLQNEFCITRVACMRRVLCCERIGEQRHSVQQASYVQSD